jgi:hypothetical protein
VFRLIKPQKVRSAYPTGLTAAFRKNRKGKRTKNKGLVLGQTEADGDDAEARVVPDTVRRTQAVPSVEPAMGGQVFLPTV